MSSNTAEEARKLRKELATVVADGGAAARGLGRLAVDAGGAGFGAGGAAPPAALPRCRRSFSPSTSAFIEFSLDLRSAPDYNFPYVSRPTRLFCPHRPHVKLTTI